MSEIFLGQIMMSGFNFAPKNFAACNGQLLPVSQNQALFSLLGTQFGGDGRVTFGLPDMRGRTPLGYAPSVDAGWQPPPYVIGQAAGSETVTLTPAQIPGHTHAVNATTTAGSSRTPAGNLVAASAVVLYGSAESGLVPLAAATVGPGGGNAPHENRQPYSTINFCIALNGILPSRN